MAAVSSEIDVLHIPTPGEQLRRRALGHTGVTLGTGVLIAILVLAAAAPLLAPHDPYAQDLSRRLIPPIWHDAGTWTHALGTDMLGRDYLSRLIYGSRISLLIGFSVIALLIAAIGIYGLIEYSVTTRTHEIGIRMAIGAQSGEIFRMIIGEGLKLSLAGVSIGLLGAAWLGRAGSSLLFRVTPTDPWTFGAVSLLLTAVATAACYFPARRAMKLDPVGALRTE